MARIKNFLRILGAVFLFSAIRAESATTNQPTPQDIIQKMYNAYSNLTSYSDSGIVRTMVSAGGQSRVQMTWFSMIFKKPGYLLVEWTVPAGGLKDTYVLWREKKDTFVYSERLKQYRKDQSLAGTIDTWKFNSGGAVRHVPCMLMKIMNKQEFDDLTGLKITGFEKVGDIECGIISGARKESRVRLWIGKKDYLLRKMETSNALGSVVELHNGIKINEKIENSAVIFTPPQGTVKVDQFK